MKLNIKLRSKYSDVLLLKKQSKEGGGTSEMGFGVPVLGTQSSNDSVNTTSRTFVGLGTFLYFHHILLNS